MKVPDGTRNHEKTRKIHRWGVSSAPQTRAQNVAAFMLFATWMRGQCENPRAETLYIVYVYVYKTGWTKHLRCAVVPPERLDHPCSVSSADIIVCSRVRNQLMEQKGVFHSMGWVGEEGGCFSSSDERSGHR